MKDNDRQIFENGDTGSLIKFEKKYMKPIACR